MHYIERNLFNLIYAHKIDIWIQPGSTLSTAALQKPAPNKSGDPEETLRELQLHFTSR